MTATEKVRKTTCVSFKPKIVSNRSIFVFCTQAEEDFLLSEIFHPLISHHIEAPIFAYFHAQAKHQEKCLTSTVFSVKYLPIFASAKRTKRQHINQIVCRD